MPKSNQKNCQNITKLIVKIWKYMNAHKYGNIWMIDKEMRKFKNMIINKINIIANYHIDLEFCLRIF